MIILNNYLTNKTHGYDEKCFLATISILLISCEKQEINDEIATNYEYKENVSIIIAHWDWGRASNDCKSGFGICNFT